MDLKSHITEYRLLKNYKDVLDRRIADLNKQIKDHMHKEQMEKFETTRAIAVLSIRNKTTYDDDKLIALLKEKGLDDCIKEVPDEQLVESAYLSGHLTDDDLRNIRKPSYVVALEVKNVQ